jgi:hypothetical protein
MDVFPNDKDGRFLDLQAGLSGRLKFRSWVSVFEWLKLDAVF